MTKSKKIQDDEIKYIKEQIKNIEEIKKENDKLFDHKDKIKAQDNGINDFIKYYNEKDEKKMKK